MQRARAPILCSHPGCQPCPPPALSHLMLLQLQTPLCSLICFSLCSKSSSSLLLMGTQITHKASAITPGLTIPNPPHLLPPPFPLGCYPRLRPCVHIRVNHALPKTNSPPDFSTPVGTAASLRVPEAVNLGVTFKVFKSSCTRSALRALRFPVQAVSGCPPQLTRGHSSPPASQSLLTQPTQPSILEPPFNFCLVQ